MLRPMTHRVDTVVVGGGYAGLTASAALDRRGVDHVVLERGRIGESWRTQRWDTFRLNTPRWMSGLSGDGFAPVSELIDALERRAATLPVQEGVEVRRVWRQRGGRYLVVTSDAVIETENIIAASGAQRVPRIPAVARSVSGRGIEHLHTADYRRAGDLVDGGVLVVGSAQSGVQIAEDLLRSGRRVHLSTSRVGRMARTYRGRDTADWLEAMGKYDEPGTSGRREVPPQVGAGRTISLQSLARDGAVLLGRVLGADGARLRLGDELGEHMRFADATSARCKAEIDAWIAAHGIDAPAAIEDPAEAPSGPVSWPSSLDLAAAGIRTVIWATGFGGDYGWLNMPIMRPDGLPYNRGGLTASPGLYVVGVPWQSTRGSGILHGMTRDAEAVAERIAGAARLPQRITA